MKHVGTPIGEYCQFQRSTEPMYCKLAFSFATLSVHTHTSVKVSLSSSWDYGAMAITCRDSCDTQSLTKEINFPVPWPRTKAAFTTERTALSVALESRTDYGTTENAITLFVHFSQPAEPFTRRRKEMKRNKRCSKFEETDYIFQLCGALRVLEY